MAVLPKPSQTPTWATTGAKVEPSAGKKALGWVLNEIPSSSFENFRADLNDKWWSWVSERFSDGVSANDLKVDTKSFGINNSDSIFGTGFWSDPGVAAATAVSHLSARSFSGQSIWQMVTKDSDLGFSAGVTVDAARVMTLQASGQVGIGNASPINKLHISATNADGIFVEDNSPFSTAPIVHVRGQRSDTSTNQPFGGRLVLDRHSSGGATPSFAALGSIYFGGNHTDGTAGNMAYGAAIIARASGFFSSLANMPCAITFNTGVAGEPSLTSPNTVGAERMRISAGGNVGIGTSNPQVSLEVTGGIRARGGVPGAGGVNNNGYAFSGGGDTDGGMFSLADGTINFFTDATERMTIKGAHVGIGENNPTSSLHIKSSVTEFIRMDRPIAPAAIWDIAIDGSGSIYFGLPTLGVIPFSVSISAPSSTVGIDASGLLVHDLSSTTSIRLNPFPSTSAYNLDIIADDTGARYSTNLASRTHRWSVGNVDRMQLTQFDLFPSVTNVTGLGTTAFRWNQLWANRGYFTENLTTPASQADLVARHAQNCILACGKQTASFGAPVLGANHWNIAGISAFSFGVYDVTFDQAVPLDACILVTTQGSAEVAPHVIVQSSTSVRVILDSTIGTGTVEEEFSIVVIGSPNTLP